MNFYQIHNLEQKEHFSTGLNIDLMSKLFKDIGAKSELKTVNDIAKYSIVVLEKGTFSLTNEHLIYVGEIKNKKQKISYSLLENGKLFFIEHEKNIYAAQLINDKLIITQPDKIEELINKESYKFKDLSEPELKAVTWLESGETGLSSLTLCSFIYPKLNILHKKLDNIDINFPHDLDDFKRCMNFFNAVPEARKEIAKLNDAGNVWKNLVDKWSFMEENYSLKNYSTINEILNECKQLKSLKPK